jgi:hypothetical protein
MSNRRAPRALKVKLELPRRSMVYSGDFRGFRG